MFDDEIKVGDLFWENRYSGSSPYSARTHELAQEFFLHPSVSYGDILAHKVSCIDENGNCRYSCEFKINLNIFLRFSVGADIFQT